MENNPSLDQETSQLSESKVPPTGSQETAKPAGSNALVEFIKHHPWIFWTGVSGFLLTIVTIAAFYLINAGRVEQEEPEPTPVAVEKPAETSPQTKNSILLWLLGAVTLSCAAGSLVMFKRFRSPARRRKLHIRHKRSATRVLPRRQLRQRRSKVRPRFPTRPEPLPQVTPVPVEEIEPMVTVLAAEESHPLDRGEESLAEMMDIRKQQPLSSFLREF